MPSSVFQVVDIPVSTIPCLRTVDAGSQLDLSFLDSLGSREGAGRLFMPKSLFLRDEMHSVWDEFVKNDDDSRVQRQILIGSPGVGKSVVFFLYALHRAQTSGKKVMYWRKSRDDVTAMSLFCMEPVTSVEDEKLVRIQWTNEISWEDSINDIYIHYMQKAYPDLYDGTVDKKVMTVRLLRNHVLMFVDGPKYSDSKDTKNGSVHFLCTSGGHPFPKSEERLSARVTVLDGWKKDPLADALKMYAKKSAVDRIWKEEIIQEEDDQKKESSDMDVDADDSSAGDGDGPDYQAKVEEVIDLVYYYTGGRIRDALKLVQDQDTIGHFAQDYDDIVSGLSGASVDLAIRAKFGTKDPKSFDTLRTYFRENGNKGPHIQIVDSAYVLSLLENSETETHYLEAYKEAIKLEAKAIAGHHFEKLMHKVFVRMSKEEGEGPLKSHIRSEGTTIQGVRQLQQKNTYWMPSVPNFPGIDAALVDSDGTIFGVQYFAGARHGFKVRAFRTKFLNHIAQEVGANADSVRIMFVVPNDQSGRPDDLPDFDNRIIEIDVESIESVIRDAKKVFQSWNMDG